MAYKSYTDNERAEAMIRLAVNKYDYDLTEQQTGISAKTLRRWDKDAPKTVPELLERAIRRLLMVIPADMTAKDWAVSLGILMDKWLLAQGMATSRTDTNATITNILESIPEDDRERVIEEAERILARAATSSPD